MNMVSVRDVKPNDVGLADESWFIGYDPQTGRWRAWSDAVDQEPAWFDTEEGAVAYWDEAANIHRSMMSDELTHAVENIVDVMLTRSRTDRYLRKAEEGHYYTTADVVFVNQDGTYTPPYVSIPVADRGSSDEELAACAIDLIATLEERRHSGERGME